jgi:hypothetical protein
MRKLQANQRNAQRSTGPKTKAGKRHSRRNALKHGILAVSLVLTESESAHEFHELVRNLRAEYQPIGMLEDMLVQKIAICWWRQKRALEYEFTLVPRAFTNEIAELERSVDPESAMSSDRLRRVLGPELDRVLRYGSAIQKELVAARRELEERQQKRTEYREELVRRVRLKMREMALKAQEGTCCASGSPENEAKSK